MAVKIPERDKDPMTRSLETTVMYLRELVEAKDELLVCYRIGRRPSDRLLKRLDELKQVKGLMGE